MATIHIHVLFMTVRVFVCVRACMCAGGSSVSGGVATSRSRSREELARLLADLHVRLAQPLPVNVDNQAAICMANNSADSARTKHIDVRFHFVRDAVLREEIVLSYCPTDQNTADVLTKPLAEDKVLKFRRAMGLR